MYTLLQLMFTLFAGLPTPIVTIIGLVAFIGIIIMLLKLIKLILDAIPFV